tara:strand:+ start:85 stop:564 length:480 start_codon:yes stop_codon:yes gene_type:complete
MEIKDFEDYTINENGDVWSKYNNRFLKPYVSEGYLQVSLYKNNKKKTFTINKLLGLVYIPNPLNYSEIDHIDRNRANNSLSNLRWATRGEQNENRHGYGEIKHKLISYLYLNKYKYYRIKKIGYFEKKLNVNKYTLKDAIDLRRSLLMYHKLPPIPQEE